MGTACDLTNADFEEEGIVVQLGYPPNRVDLITTPTGVSFTSCWTDRLELSLDGIQVPFIGLEGLKTNKRSTGRPQDLVDLETLESEPTER